MAMLRPLLAFSTSRHALDINGTPHADTGNNCVRKVNASDQSIVTIAGNACRFLWRRWRRNFSTISTYLGDRNFVGRQHIYSDFGNNRIRKN